MDEQQIRNIINEVIIQLTEAQKREVSDSDPCGGLEERCINSKGCGMETCICSGEEDEITAPDYRNRLLVPEPKDEQAYRYMKTTTPARIGVWRSGDRPLTETVIRFRADHALAMDAVFSSVDEAFVSEMKWLSLKTKVDDKDQHLTRPDLGKELCEDSRIQLMNRCDKNPQVQIIISDGLSSKAVQSNMADILPAFIQGLKLEGIEVGTPVFVKYGRVGVMDAIGEDLGAKSAVIFIGERPGLFTAESLSAYMLYEPRRGVTESQRTVLSNIHSGGTPGIEAGAHLATIMNRILHDKTSGIALG